MTMTDITDRAALSRESRSFAVTDLEVRAADNGDVSFDGIASMIDTPYNVRDAFGEFSETIARGAFNRTLKQKADVRLLINHDGTPLARTKSKTLTLSADPHLRAQASLDPANPKVQEIRSAMSRGDMDQMSIGFRVKDQEWSPDYAERTIREVELFDVSIVTYPASPTTTASVRSFMEWMDSLADLELGPDDIVRGLEHFKSLLPAETVDEARTEHGLIVTPELLALWAQRQAA